MYPLNWSKVAKAVSVVHSEVATRWYPGWGAWQHGGGEHSGSIRIPTGGEGTKR